MLYQNLYIENGDELTDIRVENGVITEIGAKLPIHDGEEARDFGGRLALPPMIESHVHLDTCLTAGDPVWNMSGTLFEGIECWALRKEKLTKADVRERVNRAVRMYAIKRRAAHSHPCGCNRSEAHGHGGAAGAAG